MNYCSTLTAKSIFWENKYDCITPLLRKLQCFLKKKKLKPIGLAGLFTVWPLCTVSSPIFPSHTLNSGDTVGPYTSQALPLLCACDLCLEPSPVWSHHKLLLILYLWTQGPLPLERHSYCLSVPHMYPHHQSFLIAVKLFLCTWIFPLEDKLHEACLWGGRNESYVTVFCVPNMMTGSKLYWVHQILRLLVTIMNTQWLFFTPASLWLLTVKALGNHLEICPVALGTSEEEEVWKP